MKGRRKVGLLVLTELAEEIEKKLNPNHFHLVNLLIPNLYNMLINYEGIEIN